MQTVADPDGRAQHRHILSAGLSKTDLARGRYPEGIHTRFPPEPNGFLHIGHAKAICLNFGMAAEYRGKCNLRFDDTNPETEDMKYVDAIRQDVRWLGFDWEDRLFFASDYFARLFEFAVELIEQGKAYVDSMSAEQIRQYRGTLTEPGVDSPWREAAGCREPGLVPQDERR